ncbi:Major facilitator superfamily [Diaporthe eres]|nr:Major facilitator superfamily [Diaporthe eres]
MSSTQPDDFLENMESRQVIVCVSQYVTCFLYGLDTTIAADVQGPVTEAFGQVEPRAWIGAGFPLGSVCVILLLGTLHNSFNIKWVFIATVVLFEAGSALCGGSPNMSSLIVGRVIAGAGGSGIYLGSLQYYVVMTEEKERGFYISLIGVFWGLGAVLLCFCLSLGPTDEKDYCVVYAIEATVHAPSLEGVYSQVFKVLKPGGVFRVYEWVMTDAYDNDNLHHRRIRLDIEQGDGIANMVKAEEALRAIKAAGFELVEAGVLLSAFKRAKRAPIRRRGTGLSMGRAGDLEARAAWNQEDGRQLVQGSGGLSFGRKGEALHANVLDGGSEATRDTGSTYLIMHFREQ